MGALLELRGQLRNMKWYGEVNRRGFIKITKKLDKKVANASTQQRYLESKVDPKQFATNLLLHDTMVAVNDWLSTLGEVKFPDDQSSNGSFHSLRRTASKTSLSLPAGSADIADRALRNDDVAPLRKLLKQVKSNVEDQLDASYMSLCLNLLQRAISCRAKDCIDELLDHTETLDEEDDINKRNCIHRLIIAMGRSKAPCEEDTQDTLDETSRDLLGITNYITPAAAPTLAPHASKTKEVDGVTSFGRGDRSVVLVQFLLDKLRPQQRDALQARDIYGRMPLHYAAQYGFVIICHILISRMQAWGQFEVEEGIDAPFWQDVDGYAPLHLSVIGGHPLTTEALLGAENWKGVNDRKAGIHKHRSKSSEVLALATKENFVQIVQLLVAAGVDLDYEDDQGETALHVAARFGHVDCAKALLAGSNNQKAGTEMAENSFGWTPLFIACVDGQIGIVELLASAGANLERLDVSGWTAKEHATLRGHMDIANMLAELTALPLGSDFPDSSSTSTTPSATTFAERRSNGFSNGNGNPKTTEAIKTFGHRYLTSESMVLVSLGTMDMRKATEAVKLDRIPFSDAHSTQLDTALSLVVSATGANGEPSITDLPVQDNVNTEPIAFTTLDATRVKLIFDIVPTYAGSNEQRVGRGVALLSSIKPDIGSKRINLQGDLEVPIVAASTLEVIGSVHFNFLIITPFSHPDMSISEDQTYWKTMTSTMVIGHRGDMPWLLSFG